MAVVCGAEPGAMGSEQHEPQCGGEYLGATPQSDEERGLIDAARTSPHPRIYLSLP